MPDRIQKELRQRYLSRSLMFWRYVGDARFAKFQQRARSAAWKELRWDWPFLGVNKEGRAAARAFGFVPTEVFAHPDVIAEYPDLLNYYRLLACLPNKGLAQVKGKLEAGKIAGTCALLNEFISELLRRSRRLTREIVLWTVFAEAGSEWQGTWVNNIGLLAAQEMEKMILDYARAHRLVARPSARRKTGIENVVALKSGTTLRFGSEPDVECRNKNGDLICVIEIKGSADKAGAQTRLGETKKSFTKAKLENPRCTTIFLPSILTPAVAKQLKTERDIDKVFNLLDILRDSNRREEFLNELFRFCLREDV